MPESEGPIMLAIGRLEGKVEGFLAKQAEQNHRLNNHSDRISALEKFKSKILGIAVAAGVVASAAFKFLPSFLK